MGAGIVAVLTCVGVNAGSTGEQLGARAQDRWFDSLRAPQGDWPPYAPDRVVDGEVAERPVAASPRRGLVLTRGLPPPGDAVRLNRVLASVR